MKSLDDLILAEKKAKKKRSPKKSLPKQGNVLSFRKSELDQNNLLINVLIRKFNIAKKKPSKNRIFEVPKSIEASRQENV